MTYSAICDGDLVNLLDAYYEAVEELTLKSSMGSRGVSAAESDVQRAEDALFAHIEKQVNRTC